MSANSSLGSARVRKPTIGRVNKAEDVWENVPVHGKLPAEKYHKTADIFSLNNSIKSKWNDTLLVSRQFSPRDPSVPKPKHFPPIFPRSSYPTVPPYEEPPRRKRPLACPRQWIEENQKSSEYDRTTLEDPANFHIKDEIVKEFIERNRDQLGQLDQSFYNKTPREIRRLILDDSNFLSTMETLNKREKCIALGTSINTKECLEYNTTPSFSSSSSSAFLHEPQQHTLDPYATSLTTTRSARERKVLNLFQPAAMDVDKRHHRGYDHTPEYGNFSKFNGLLKANAGSVLKR